MARSSSSGCGTTLRFTGSSSFRSMVGNDALSGYVGGASVFVEGFSGRSAGGLGFSEMSWGVMQISSAKAGSV